MTKTIQLALAGCLAMSTAALAQQSSTTRPSNQGSIPADRASGRDPGGLTGDTSARDRLPDAPTGGLTGAGTEASMQQQLAAIARQPELAGDKLFVLEAAMGNQWEIEFSRMVAEKAQDPQVKQAAQQLVTDHTAAQQRLQQVAEKMNLSLPSSLPATKQQKLQVFSAMPADKLEKCFVISTKAAHAKDVTCYSDMAQAAQNADLKAYITETLPKLQQHAQHIQTAAAAKGLPGEMTTASGAMGQQPGQQRSHPAGQMPTGRTE